MKNSCGVRVIRLANYRESECCFTEVQGSQVESDQLKSEYCEIGHSRSQL